MATGGAGPGGESALQSVDKRTEAEGRRNRERKRRRTGRRRRGEGDSNGWENAIPGGIPLTFPFQDSPMPSGPSLLKLNLGTCMLETGSLGLGNPPF